MSRKHPGFPDCPATVFLFIACLFGWSSAVQAHVQSPQATDSIQLMDMSIDELMSLKVTTVTTASKYAQKVSQAPSSVSVITSEDIKRFGYRTLGEALQSLIGFYSTYDRNYSQLGIRGFGRLGDYNTRVLMLVDGYRTNAPLYETGSTGTDFFLDPDLIDRIEVIRGPGAAIYGNNAFFCVVNLITRNGSDIQGNELSGETGSLDTFRGRFTHAPRQREGRDLVVSTSFLNSGGHDRIFYPEFNSPATNQGFAENLDYDKNFQTFFKYRQGHFTWEWISGRRTKALPTASYGTVFNAPGSETTDSFSMLALNYQQSSGKNGDLSLRLSNSRMSYEGRYLYDFAPPGSPPDEVWDSDSSRGTRWTIDGQWTKKIRNHHLILGGEFKDLPQMDQTNFDRVLNLDVHNRSSESAWFFQDEVTFNQKWSLMAGLRADQQKIFGDKTSPRFALIFHPEPQSAVKLLYGKAFRSPNGYESYYQDNGLSQKTNPDLQPETNETFEGVYERSFRHDFSGSVSFYKYKMKNLISLVEDPADNLMVFRNSMPIEAHGLEWTLRKGWPDGKECRLSAAVQENRDAASRRILTNSPRQMARFSFRLPLMEKKLQCGFETQYFSSRGTLKGNETGNVVLSNLTLTHRNISHNVEFTLSCYNLFDKSYKDPASEEFLQDSLKQDGRTFRFKVTSFF